MIICNCTIRSVPRIEATYSYSSRRVGGYVCSTLSDRSAGTAPIFVLREDASRSLPSVDRRPSLRSESGVERFSVVECEGEVVTKEAKLTGR